MELLKMTKKYTNKEGKEVYYTNLYVRLPNGDCIAIKPVFSKGGDLFKLIANANRVHQLNNENDKELPF